MVRVGTVDKFQAQRRDLAGAVSRIPRREPSLLEVNCKTIDQMRLANALCRFVELAEPAKVGA